MNNEDPTIESISPENEIILRIATVQSIPEQIAEKFLTSKGKLNLHSHTTNPINEKIPRIFNRY